MYAWLLLYRGSNHTYSMPGGVVRQQQRIILTCPVYAGCIRFLGPHWLFDTGAMVSPCANLNRETAIHYHCQCSSRPPY